MSGSGREQRGPDGAAGSGVASAEHGPMAGAGEEASPAVGSAARRAQVRRSTLRLVALAFATFGFGFALVPLYDVLCEITGLNGKTGRVDAAAIAHGVDTSREIVVEFVASTPGFARWRFEPSVTKMRVHPGEIYETLFYAENLASEQTVGQAVPSVSPTVASLYFNKTECFCFTRQEFAPLEGREMPVRFVINPDIPPEVKTVTLSYSFFEVDESS